VCTCRRRLHLPHAPLGPARISEMHKSQRTYLQLPQGAARCIPAVAETDADELTGSVRGHGGNDLKGQDTSSVGRPPCALEGLDLVQSIRALQGLGRVSVQRGESTRKQSCRFAVFPQFPLKLFEPRCEES
jgi:hypothetical protein